jgi:hypothetical protein
MLIIRSTVIRFTAKISRSSNPLTERHAPSTYRPTVNTPLLSRVYRDFTTITERNSAAARNRKSTDRTSKNESEPAQKPDPFLIGCTIAILGGQRKWFEDIVTETGAELVHDTGDNPERIAAALHRSNALFMLLTSTSHRATWEGVEIAKAQGIPHFVIQGSKSNLRKLLRENRQLIKDARKSG